MRYVFKAETELANRMRTILASEGWDVYDEIQTGGGTCDLVGKRGPFVHLVECKLTAGLPVLKQAHNNKVVGHYSSVAVPVPRAGLRTLDFFIEVAGRAGIGVYAVAPWSDSVQQLVRPSFQRNKASDRLLSNLCEEAKVPLAGTNRGGASTPFKRLAASVEKYVRENPGRTLKEVVEGVEGMYWAKGSAPYTLKSFIGGKTMPGLECRFEYGRWRVYAKVAD